MSGYKLTDIINKKYGMLTIIEELEPVITKTGVPKRVVLCRCDCGNTTKTRLYYLTHGDKKSCGCLKRTMNGLGTSRIAKIWREMHRRCEDPKNEAFERYGGKGIKVCQEWSGNEGFFKFREWSLANGYTDKLTIDRKDGNDGYNPENCRWVTYKVQNNNLSSNHIVTYNGESHTVSEWADIVGVPYHRLSARINKLNYPIEEALGLKKHELKYHDMKEVIQLDKYSNCEIARFKSIGEASKVTSVDRASISKCCSNIIGSAGGYKWAFI